MINEVVTGAANDGDPDRDGDGEGASGDSVGSVESVGFGVGNVKVEDVEQFVSSENVKHGQDAADMTVHRGAHSVHSVH